MVWVPARFSHKEKLPSNFQQRNVPKIEQWLILDTILPLFAFQDNGLAQLITENSYIVDLYMGYWYNDWNHVISISLYMSAWQLVLFIIRIAFDVNVLNCHLHFFVSKTTDLTRHGIMTSLKFKSPKWWHNHIPKCVN